MKNMNLCKHIYIYLNISLFNDLKTHVNIFAKCNVYKRDDEKYAYVVRKSDK